MPAGDLEMRYDGLKYVDIRDRATKKVICFVAAASLQEALELTPLAGGRVSWEEVKAAARAGAKAARSAPGTDPLAAWRRVALSEPAVEAVVESVLDEIQKLPGFQEWHAAGERVLKAQKTVKPKTTKPKTVKPKTRRPPKA